MMKGKFQFSKIFRKEIAWLLLFVLLFFSCQKEPIQNPITVPPEDFFIRGVDLSFAPEISSYNISYLDGSTPKPILQLVKEKGINTIRLRLWHTPATSNSSLSEIVVFAKEIKLEGLKFWLDFHYSDTWADPGHQQKPAAWSNLDFEGLKDSIYSYTRNTLMTLEQNGALPDFVQVGNETNDGILWNDGKIYTGNGDNWNNFHALIKEATTAIREVSPGPIIIHYAGYNGADDYFENLASLQTDFDIIGLSYYPAWHGKNLDSLESAIDLLSSQFQKPVVFAETAYPWTLEWNDWTHNQIGLTSQIIPNYPATPEGQAGFIGALIDLSKSVSNTDNFGVCYWAADWVAFKGPVSTECSPWENQALFDFQFKALPALDTLGKR